MSEPAKIIGQRAGKEAPMRALVLRVSEEKTSKREGSYFHIFFKGDDGRSYKTMVNLIYRNFKYWQSVINHGIGKWYDGLFIKKDDLIDADSVPVECSAPQGARLSEGEAGIVGGVMASTPEKVIVDTPPRLFSDWDRGRQKLHEARSLLNIG